MRYYSYRENEEHRTNRLPIAYYLVNEYHPRYEMTHHWHKEFEIIFVRRGKLSVTLDEEKFELSEGEMLFVNPGVIHSGNPHESEYECAVFRLEAPLRQYLSGSYEGKALLAGDRILPPLLFRSNQMATTIALRLFEAMREQPIGFELTAFSAVAELFGLVLSENLLISLRTTSGGFAERILPFENAVSFIEEHYSEPITLGQLAATAGISRKYFSEYFKKVSGKSPFEYLAGYRVERASELLLHTDRAVTDIALDCGFNDLSYFIKTFKRQTGATPAKWRAKQ